MINSTQQNVSDTRDRNVLVYICIHLVMPCAVAIGIIGNLLSILVFARREMIKFCVSIFTIVLAVSDILLLITSLFNIILPDFLGEVLSDRSAFWCYFHGYFDLLFAAVSSYSVVFISVERWFSVWKPFDKVKWVTFKTTIIAVISYISMSMISCSWFPVTLQYNSIEQKPGERCGMKRPILYKIFGSISVVFTYIAPFIFLGILNILIVYQLHARQHTSIQRAMAAASSASADSALGSTSSRKRQRQRNIDRNITFMLIAVAIAFMVMSFPYQIYWFYMQIRQLAQPDATLFTLTQTFRYLNCCCNFFLYSATSSLFRRELREIFQCSPPSNVQQTKTKITYVNQTTSVTRSRTASSPPTLNLTAIDAAMTTPAERETLLARSISAKVLQVDSVECLDLAPAQPRNGHVVSFKT